MEPARALSLVGRWCLGTGLVSWRYLWETTPLHRTEEAGDPLDPADAPPALAPEVAGEPLLRAEDGYGPLYHRRFTVRVAGPRLQAQDVLGRVQRDFKKFVPSEVVDVHTQPLGPRGLEVGDELLVEMPGPWNGPVRVVRRTPTSLRLATLRDHLEAGQVEFRARDDADELTFDIELWARSSTRLTHVLYSRLRLSKEVQLNMWVRYCLAVVGFSGGRLVDGVRIGTRVVA